MTRTDPLDATALADLEAQLDGELLRPSDEGFDAARAVWNGRFDRRPAVIARCASREDVQRAVAFARRHGVGLSVKSGGHDYAGRTVGEGGLLIDLGPMSEVAVDPAARRVVAGPGATWRDVDEATQAHGLATPGGTVSSVGVAGFALGGGAGWLTRKHGLAVDNLVAAEVVTASGELVRASEAENAELLWGLRGGGANLGIVTRFEFALHEVGPDVFTAQIFHPGQRAAELLRFYRDHMRGAPDELMAFFFLLRVPPVDPFPEEHHGALVVDFVVTWLGDPEDGPAALEPFRALGEPILEFAGVQPYAGLQQSFDAGMAPKGNRWYSRFHYLDALSDDAIDAIVAGLDPFPGAFTTVYLADEGGAPSRVAPEETAFPHRTAACSVHVFPGWIEEGDDDAIMSWARRLSEAIAPHAAEGVYVNMLAEDEAHRIPAAYGPNHDRLAALKAEWDPDNVFRQNHNVRPRSG